MKILINDRAAISQESTKLPSYHAKYFTFTNQNIIKNDVKETDLKDRYKKLFRRVETL